MCQTQAKYDYIPARVELNKTVPITCEENILQQDLQAQKELNRKRSDIRCDVANAVKVKAFNRTRNTIDHNETRSAGRRQHFADSYEVRHSNLQSRCGDAVFRRFVCCEPNLMFVSPKFGVSISCILTQTSRRVDKIFGRSLQKA